MNATDASKPKRLRPRDAATLIIVRGGEQVLMGIRNAKHAFMPNKYVFPGGRVDRADGQVRSPLNLKSDVAEKLERGCTPNRARAIGMAVVRETFEETGLILGADLGVSSTTRSPNWRSFYETGFVPALDKIDYIARAVTPPGRPRRFDARFFMADAEHLVGDLYGNGELLNLTWVPLKDALELDLPNITQLMIRFIRKRIEDGAHRKKGGRIPFVRTIRGQHQIGEH